MKEPILQIEKLTYAYPGHEPSLREVTLALEEGERVALLGSNGRGKSTLLHLANGLFFAQSGRVLFRGTELTADTIDRDPLGPRFRSQVGFLFQGSDVQLFCATVQEELAFGPLQLGLAPDQVDERVTETLELMDIAHLRDRVPQRLSAGEKKAVALASLLTVGPRLLLLDEPTAGLDPRSQSMLVDILEQLHGAGVTLLTATHDLILCDHVADRALVMGEENTIVADGETPAILGDLELLKSVNLVHTHLHHHGTVEHRHPHVHVAPHDHSHDH